MPGAHDPHGDNPECLMCGARRPPVIEYSEASEPHDDQVQVWSEELTSGITPWIRDFENYDDKIDFFGQLQYEIKQIAKAAHAAGMARAKAR